MYKQHKENQPWALVGARVSLQESGVGVGGGRDAAVVGVSEETGVICVAVDGYLTRGYNVDTLRSKLTELVEPVSPVKEGKKIFRFMRKGTDKNAERGGKSER